MSIDYFYKLMGWKFLFLAAFFTLGLVPQFARRFYPNSPSCARRLAAPLIFAGLAVTCCAGVGIWALACFTVLGLTQSVVSRLIRRRDRCAT